MTMDMNDLLLSVEEEAIAAVDDCILSCENYKYAKIPSISWW